MRSLQKMCYILYYKKKNIQTEVSGFFEAFLFLLTNMPKRNTMGTGTVGHS